MALGDEDYSAAVDVLYNRYKNAFKGHFGYAVNDEDFTAVLTGVRKAAEGYRKVDDLHAYVKTVFNKSDRELATVAAQMIDKREFGRVSRAVADPRIGYSSPEAGQRGGSGQRVIRKFLDDGGHSF